MVGDARGPMGAWVALKAETEIDYALSHAMQPDPVPTGIGRLDKALNGGLPVGTFTVVAGEAGCGKSALACVAQYNAAKAYRYPVYFSYEMTAQMVVSRLLSVFTADVRAYQEATGVPESERMRQVWWSSTRKVVRDIVGRGISDPNEALMYVNAYATDDPVLAAWDEFGQGWWRWMAVDDSARTISDACERIDGLCEAGIRPMPIIDYLQLATDADGEGSEYERVTQASGALLACAKRWQIPMLVISSMRNVGREEAKDGPRLSWLRSSGRIGFDAGTVIIMRRDGERQGSEQPILAHVVKNRVGPYGDAVPLMFNGGKNEFR